MNRRGFLKRLGIALAVAPVAPALLARAAEPDPDMFMGFKWVRIERLATGKREDIRDKISEAYRRDIFNALSRHSATLA